MNMTIEINIKFRDIEALKLGLQEIAKEIQEGFSSGYLDDGMWRIINNTN